MHSHFPIYSGRLFIKKETLLMHSSYKGFLKLNLNFPGKCRILYLFSLFPFPDPGFLPGDVDLDGKVTAADARLALRRAVLLETFSEDSLEFRAADVDFDGVVTSSDARMILRAAVGLETLRRKDF